MTESKVDLLAVLDKAAASFDNIRFERRDDPNAERLDVYWSTRIAEVHAARSAATELIDALRIAVRQNSHDMLMTGEELRVCEAALAACTPAKEGGR